MIQLFIEPICVALIAALVLGFGLKFINQTKPKDNRIWHNEVKGGDHA